MPDRGEQKFGKGLFCLGSSLARAPKEEPQDKQEVERKLKLKSLERPTLPNAQDRFQLPFHMYFGVELICRRR